MGIVRFQVFRSPGSLSSAHLWYSLPSMGSLCFGFHPSTLASTLQILYIFYIISFLDLKK